MEISFCLLANLWAYDDSDLSMLTRLAMSTSQCFILLFNKLVHAMFTRLYFYRATSMQGAVLAMSEMSVRPSVCLSNACMDCDKTKETCAHILTPHKITFILVF